MAYWQAEFRLSTREHHALVDITDEVRRLLSNSGFTEGQVCVYTPHATSAITVNENDDPNIAVDLLRALRTLVPDHHGWLHDRIDNNAAAHIKSALVGPSVTLPYHGGQLGLGRWQNVFFCEFDGPRRERRVIVSLVG